MSFTCFSSPPVPWSLTQTLHIYRMKPSKLAQLVSLPTVSHPSRTPFLILPNWSLQNPCCKTHEKDFIPEHKVLSNLIGTSLLNLPHSKQMKPLTLLYATLALFYFYTIVPITPSIQDPLLASSKACLFSRASSKDTCSLNEWVNAWMNKSLWCIPCSAFVIWLDFCQLALLCLLYCPLPL